METALLPFTGTFNGNNYTISNLFISLPSTNDVGLFGETSGATIENVGLVNANITGQNHVGGLLGLMLIQAPSTIHMPHGNVSGVGNWTVGIGGLSWCQL